MPVSKRDSHNNAIPGGSPRSPSAREGSSRLGAPYGDAAKPKSIDTTTPPDRSVLEQFLELLNKKLIDGGLTLTGLIALRHLLPAPTGVPRLSLADRFLIPPFSVLDARQGYWQKRKRMWLELGIRSELGRGENYDDDGSLGINEQARSHYRTNATPSGSPMPAMSLKGGVTQRGDGRGRPLAQTFDSGRPSDLAAGFRRRAANSIPGGGTGKNSAYLFKTPSGYKSLKELGDDDNNNTPHPTQSASHDGLTISVTCGAYDARKGGELTPAQSGTSIFDPVLCELAYRWFCPAGGRVLDPFAGGSVRGIVAARTGRAYTGVDLRPEQATANEEQRVALCPDADLRWVVGDAADLPELLSPDPEMYDFLFSCPPYADLERYSDDPRDLSTMEYDAFLRKYRHIIAASCEVLRPDRFACFVVGDVRDRKTGNYRGFVGDTIEAFRACGLELYNDAVLITAVGSLPIRVGKQFAGYRKLGKTHQNVLVFVKGDAARAAAACGEVDVDDLDMPDPWPGGVAVCAQDCTGLLSEGLIDGDGTEVPIIGDCVEAYILADILRGEAMASGLPEPRIWVCTDDGWTRVEVGTYLTYLVGDAVYLNRDVFRDAPGPVDVPPPPKPMRT